MSKIGITTLRERRWSRGFGQFLNAGSFCSETFEYSGLIQIRKYAEIHKEMDLLSRFEDIQASTKGVKKAIYELLVRECGYFK